MGWEQVSRSAEQEQEEDEGGERPICAMRSYVRSPSPETGDYKNPCPILVSVVLWMALHFAVKEELPSIITTMHIFTKQIEH